MLAVRRTADFLVFHSFERHYRGVSVKIFMQCWRTACTSVLSYHSSSHVRSRTRCNSCSVRIKRTIIRLGENTRILTYFIMGIDVRNNYARCYSCCIPLIGAGSNSKVERHKLTALCAGRKIFHLPLHFSVVPLQMGGHNKNRVGTANSFLSVMTRWR